MFASHSSSGGTSASCSNCTYVRLCFLIGTRSIVHSFFKHDNGFYHVREGDLLGRPFFSIQIKLMHGGFSTNLRPWIHSARSLLPSARQCSIYASPAEPLGLDLLMSYLLMA